MTTFALPTLSDEKARAPTACSACIDSWRINVPDQTTLVDALVADVRARRGGTVFTINLDHLSRLRWDGDFRAAYERATYISADGVPVVVLARAEGVPIQRVTGADLVEPLCRAAAEAGIAVHFFGARPDVVERAVERLRSEIPTLTVAGIESPPMGFDPTGEAARAAAQRIADSGAGLCFIALGAPKQEIFANAAVCWTEGVVFLGIGAALDFLAGNRRRAPVFLQKIGLEWLWRVAQEPRRLAGRYLRSGLWLIGYVMRVVLGLVDDRPRLTGDLICRPVGEQPSSRRSDSPT